VLSEPAYIHNLGERTGLHFLHGAPAVRLDRDFADLQLAGDFLIENAIHDQRHHLSLAPESVA
jgi:hypothetical protein